MQAVENWESQIARAYAVFGIDPLDRADEFGFRFPRLSVSFLREKAERQLRDVLGRWRKMRADLDVGNSGSPLERASLRPPQVTTSNIEEFATDIETLNEVIKNYEATHDVSLIGRNDRFIYPDEENHASMVDYIERLKYEKALDIIRKEKIYNGEISADDNPRGRWVWEAVDYEDGIGEERPTVAGTPEEREALIDETAPYFQALRRHRQSQSAQYDWDRTYLSIPKEDHDKITAAGHNDPPTVVSMEAFDAYTGYTIPEFENGDMGRIPPPDPGKGTVLFRGKEGSTVPSKDIVANITFARAEDHYVGRGIYGNGLYFGNLSTARGYAGPNSSETEDIRSLITDEGSIFAAKLKPDAVVVAYNDVHNMASRKYDEILFDTSLTSEQKDAAFAALKSMGIGLRGAVYNEELAAAALGIDAVINTIGRGFEQNIVVFNRGALVVPDYDLPYTPRDKPPRPKTIPEPERPGTFRLRSEVQERYVF